MAKNEQFEESVAYSGEDKQKFNETSTIKTFKSQSEVENFYRFIYENDLRIEAFEIIKKKLETMQI